MYGMEKVEGFAKESFKSAKTDSEAMKDVLSPTRKKRAGKESFGMYRTTADRTIAFLVEVADSIAGAGIHSAYATIMAKCWRRKSGINQTDADGSVVL
jgi:hypothetical protein